MKIKCETCYGTGHYGENGRESCPKCGGKGFVEDMGMFKDDISITGGARKRYDVIYADPPWSYKVWSEDKKQAQGCAKRYYPTMDIKDICALPVSDICSDNAKLFLWATPPCIREALEVMKSWGFEYKTFAFVWIKLNKKQIPGQSMLFLENSIHAFHGIGHWTASNAEVVLCGLRKGGRLNRQDKSISQVILAPLTRHSEKPKEVAEKIVRLCGNVPRIELFARDKKPGWDVWGNEIDSDITFK